MQEQVHSKYLKIVKQITSSHLPSLFEPFKEAELLEDEDCAVIDVSLSVVDSSWSQRIKSLGNANHVSDDLHCYKNCCNVQL